MRDLQRLVETLEWMMNEYNCIAFKCGNIESNMVSWVVYQATDKIPLSKKEALEGFVEYLWRKWSSENKYKNKYSGRRYNVCCMPALLSLSFDKKEAPSFCPECGISWKETPAFNIPDWLDFIRNLHFADNDSYGNYSDRGDFTDPYGWDYGEFIFHILHHQMVIITSNAEKIFLSVLNKLHPELEIYDYLVTYNYDDIIDPETILNQYGEYSKDKYETIEVQINPGTIKLEKVKKPRHTEIIQYESGALAVIENGFYRFIKYNTGDRVWFKFENGKYQVTKITQGTA